MVEITLEMLLAATGGRVLRGHPPAAFFGVSTDTRTLRAGALFVALRGEQFDAHQFVEEAFARGAGAAVVSLGIAATGALIFVEDTLKALGAIAGAHRAALPVQVIAVTGSTGKTTTKDMIAAILSRGGATARTPGNFNNEVGVPLALLELDASYRTAVVELAMRRRGEIAYLSGMAKPNVGVITNIGVSHMELLGSRERIAETKAELLTALPENGTAVLNADDDFFAFLKARTRATVVSFGTNAADVRASEVAIGAAGRAQFRLTGWWGEQRITLKAAGRHHVLNAAAAAAAAMSAGAKPEWVEAGLAAFEAGDMRGRIVRAPGGYTVINDSYNAAPDSMRAALELLMDLPGERKWAVLGDMKELGKMTVTWHHQVGELAAGMGIAGLVTVGALGRHIADGARPGMAGREVIEAESNRDAAHAIAARAKPGDVVLVKGSRAMQMEEIVTGLTGASGSHG
jgi:UDP-N-acetylmuramoyl-tripeptide--D-alanyl-D-alanine ligase